MICIKNGLEYKYDYSHKKFQTAFEFLKRKDLATLPVGTIELGYGVRALIQRYETMKWEDRKFETHEKYFDIQFVLEGMECCGVCNREMLGEQIGSYDPEEDIVFYEEPAFSSKVFLNAGDFVVLGPEDAHKPRCEVNGPIAIKKVVCKVPV